METYIVKVNGKTYEVEVEKQGEQAVQSIEPVKNSSPSKMPSGQEVTCGTSGKIWKVVQTEGAQVKKGGTIMILEAMKMESPIVSPFDGTIETILAAEGDSVEAGQPVAVVACEGKLATA